MACGGCVKRRQSTRPINNAEDLKGGYKYLTDRQLRARLEIYKRNNCKDCSDRYKCDYPMFIDCKKYSK